MIGNGKQLRKREMKLNKVNARNINGDKSRLNFANRGENSCHN